MYALMFYKTALLTEQLLAHFTDVRAFTAMYALMCYETALNTE